MKIFGNRKKYRHIKLQSATSTNSYIKQLDAEQPLEHATVVSAVDQTAGRGQRGNSWESEKGKNLTFSVMLKPDFIKIREQFAISEISALAVKDTLDKYCSDITIKWPNDIYYKDKKICGMLIENDTCGEYLTKSIPGIGININQEVFRSDAPNPVSLFNITGRTYDTDSILDECMHHLLRRYKEIATPEGREATHNQFLASLYRKGVKAGFRDCDGEFTGTITGVEPYGRLIIEKESGEERRYEFKEVAYII